MRPFRRNASAVAVLAVLTSVTAAGAGSFVTFESGQVRPLAMSADGTRLFAVNTPDDRLEVYAVLDAARDDRDVRAVLITGTEECFTSGNDIVDFLQEPPSGADSPVFQSITAAMTAKPAIITLLEAP